MVDRHAMLYGVFVAMDADGSGYVDEDEFMSIFSRTEEKHARARLMEIDNVGGRGGGEGDGRLSHQ